jgi:hypothetical protein
MDVTRWAESLPAHARGLGFEQSGCYRNFLRFTPSCTNLCQNFVHKFLQFRAPLLAGSCNSTFQQYVNVGTISNLYSLSR